MSKFQILIVLISFSAFNANALEGAEVDVSRLKPAESSAMSTDEIVKQIKRDIATAKRFIDEVEKSTEQMQISHEKSKRLVALCNARNARAIVGKAARDAYDLACNGSYTELKKRSERAAKIVDQMKQHLPIAGAVLKDGSESIELLKALGAAKEQMTILENIIEESDGTYKSLINKE